MKPGILCMPIMAAFFFITPSLLHGQDSMQATTSQVNVKDSAQYSDKAFLQNSIKHLSVEYKLAEMAAENAQRPKIKQAAREMMANDTILLQRLMATADAKKVPGVSKAGIEKMVKEVQSDRIFSPSDKLPQGVTGNTATDKAGSGSSGSGNVKGEDTGTIARTQSNKPDEDGYSEQGDYAYNNQSFLADVESVGKASGNDFEVQWLDMMAKLQNQHIDQYNNAINLSKNDDIRSTALYALPRAKMMKETIMRLIKNAGPSRSVDPNTQRAGGQDDNTNRPQQNPQR